MQGQRGMEDGNELEQNFGFEFLTHRRNSRRYREVWQLLDMLLEVILVGQVFEHAGPELLARVQACYESWKIDVPLQLLRKRVALYTVPLTAENSLNAHVSNPEQKMLKQFVTLLLRPSQRVFEFTPSYHLKIKKEFFSSENYENFAEFLTFQENTLGLVKISMAIPINGGSMDFGLPPFSLPIMRELNIQFSDQGITGHSFGSNDNFVPFLQLILDGANELEKLEFSHSQNNTIPAQLLNLTFPESLKSLYLEFELTCQQLEPLTAKSLPNLRNFGVMISPDTFTNDLLFRVLDKFKSTLKRLYFYGIIYSESCIPRVGHVSYFRFPVMESLKSFVNFTILGELEDGLLNLETALPNVIHLSLKQQTREMFQKWIHNSSFPTVTSLDVGLVDDTVPEENLDHDISVGEQQMILVHSAFPNVTVLNLNVAGDLSGLTCLFIGTLPLTELKLVVKNNGQRSYGDFWDCLLIGVSPQHGIRNLRLYPELVNNRHYLPPLPCIRRFPALRFLSLSASFPPSSEQDSLISNAAFTLAFLRMPNLKRLDLVGMFWASHFATELWELDHRTINYAASDDVNAHQRYI